MFDYVFLALSTMSSRLTIKPYAWWFRVTHRVLSLIFGVNRPKYYVYDELRTRAFPCCVRGRAGGAYSHQLACFVPVPSEGTLQRD